MTRAFLIGGFALALAATSQANAQPPALNPSRPSWEKPATPATPTALSGPHGLLGHVGTDAASRLMRSTDAGERLRGIERAAATPTPEAVALLERAARSNGPGGLDPRLPDEGFARKDPRALLAVVRGLAAWLDNEGARAALEEVVRAPVEAFAVHGVAASAGDPAGIDTAGAARVTLARQEAAIALAGSGNSNALEQLVAIARSGGSSQEAALLGLSVHPPSDPLPLGGVALTTPGTIALAARIGDLRTLDAILGAIRASDPALRAAAIAALGTAGDTRVADVARGALHDEDPRVRVAAVEALARLAAPDAAPGVEALIGDDATALEGLRIAQQVQGEGLTKAAAARAAVTVDPAMRSAALAALGRQTRPSAIHALVTLAQEPRLQGDALAAIARSPSRAAMGALESWAGPAGPAASTASPGVSRRLAGRAYFVRRAVRGERSPRLDALLDSLASSGDPRDRAVGTEARVALGEEPLDVALSDGDPRVRRAAAMGSLALLGQGAGSDRKIAESLVARAAIEADEATRRVLAIGWLDASADATVATSVLVDRATQGGSDAPLAALALARRSNAPEQGADDALDAQVDALLGSRDALLRAHAARGLGSSRAPDAVGRLSRAYAWEGDASVRRAIVVALAARPAGDGQGGARQIVLELAARLDPDPVARWAASTALAMPSTGRSLTMSSEIEEVAWLRLVPAEGAAPALDRAGFIARNDGIAVPIAFDDEGYALVPGVPPGEALLRLAPGLPSYTPPAP